MRVIGISGMHNSISFKRRALPGLDERRYRIVQGLDAAAALVTDAGVVAAAAEERFTGEKTTGAFPVEAIGFCLDRAGLGMSDVDSVAFGFDYRRDATVELSEYAANRFAEVYSPDVKRGLLGRHWPELDWERRFVAVPHHLAHAASSFYLSGFDESLILVADGMGEKESMSVAVGRGRDIEILRSVPALHSIGTLYGAVTLYLGFEFGMDEYKVMGLAPYGDRKRYYAEVMRLIQLRDGGGYVVPALAAENRTWLEHETLDGTLHALTECFGPAREPGEPMTQRHMDVAAGIQAGLEATLLHVLRHAKAETGLTKLCMAGGVALNCTANGLISRSRMFDGVFVQPASGDDGSALGAALYVHAQRAAHDIRRRMDMPYWGPEFSDAEITEAIAGQPGCAGTTYRDHAGLAGEVARLIAGGDVVAWFQGRMEFGPRALGNRSILADPRSAGMRDHLNSIVKQREDFRPFAPVVRVEDVHRFFDVVEGAEERYAHMLFVVRTKAEHRETLPAVTHVDGTARVQIVRREDNPRLWELIGAFGALTGVPVLLNTSFNLRGQPVIRDPELALRTFAGSRLDHLVLGDHLVHRVSEAAPVEPRTPVTMPADLPAPPFPGFQHDHCRLALSAEETVPLREFAAARAVGAGAVALAALAAVLTRYTGRDDVVIGALDQTTGEPVAVRRTCPTGTSLAELVSPVAGSPIGDDIRVVLLFGGDAGIRSTAAAMVDRDLVIQVLAEPSGWLLGCAYDPERYLPDSAARLLDDLRAVLAAMVARPDTVLGELPIERRAEAPEPEAVPAQVSGDDPRGQLERGIARIWSEVLDLPEIGRDENFFVLGGHSLLAVQVAGRMRERFDVELPVDQLFATPTVRAAAEQLQRERAKRRAPVEPPHRRGDTGVVPVSASQERIWFHEQWRPGTAAYNQPWALELRGRLDIAALTGALNEVVRRHEILRTTFDTVDGLPVPVCRARLDLTIRRHEVRDCGQLEDFLTKRACEPFDLARGPLVRADLVRVAADRHVLLLTLHHLVNDGWSLEILLRELAVCYDGRAPELPELPLQYADAAAWQRSALRGEVLEEAVRYFAGQLDGAPAQLDLPADHPRPPVPSYAGDTVEFTVSEELTWALRQLGRERGVTPFVVLLAAFQALLHRQSGQESVVVGTTCANRDRPELEDLIGPFFNTLALRADFAADPSFVELLDQVRERTLGAFARQEVPFETVVERLAPQRDAGRSPLFQVLLELAEPAEGEAPDGLAWSSRLIDTRTSKLDLTLTMTHDAGVLRGLATYSTDLFERVTISRLLSGFLTLLEDACAEPDRRVSELAILSEVDRAVIAEVNDTASVYSNGACLHELFEAQVARRPEAIAVRTADARISYADLNAAANRLAWRLRALGVEPESRVALCLDRSIDMLVGMLGILKAGGAYLPIEPGYPLVRRQALAAGTSLLVGTRSAASWYQGTAVWLDDLDVHALPEDNPPRLSTPDNLACVMYTSGSTGAPKGVLVAHRGLVNYVENCVTDYVGDGTGGAPVFSSFAFDMLVPNIFAPLACGQPVWLVPASASPAELGEHLAAGAPYAFIKLTPSHLELLAEQLDAATARRLCQRLVVGADAFPARTLAAWRRLDPDTPVWNEYGPTEASVANAVLALAEPAEREIIPIGRPIANTSMYVLDAGLRQVPVGVPGELYIGGDCVVRGYADRPDLTVERFLPDPFSVRPGGRMYRTGDRGRLLGDGNFEFLGRVDEQVKIDGFRVEPGEIEAALVAHPEVRQAVVLAGADQRGGRRLVGYVVTDGPDELALLEFLGRRLPRHLVPARLVVLDRIPLTGNGKLDRSALPQPVNGVVRPAGRPATALQDALRGLWSDVLGLPIEHIGLDDDFFAAGGRSLDVVRLVSRIRDTLRVSVPAARLFRASTVTSLAEVVVEHEITPGASERIATAMRTVAGLSQEERAELVRRHRLSNTASATR